MDGVVGTQGMRTRALRGLREERVADSVYVDCAPETLEIIECSPELRRGQTSSFTHSGKRRGGLDMCNRDGSDVICIAVGALGLVGSGLVDQQLDQGAGIEVEAQRRPSAT